MFGSQDLTLSHAAHVQALFAGFTRLALYFHAARHRKRRRSPKAHSDIVNRLSLRASLLVFQSEDERGSPRKTTLCHPRGI